MNEQISYKSANSVASWVKVLCVLLGIWLVINVFSTFQLVSNYSSLRDEISELEKSSNLTAKDKFNLAIQRDLLERLPERLENRETIYLATILPMMVFLFWQYLVHRNLFALGQKIKYTPIIGALSWLIPIINFVLPFQVIYEIGKANKHTASATKKEYGWLITVCAWATFAVTAVVCYGLYLTLSRTSAYSNFQMVLYSLLGGDILLLLATALAIISVNHIQSQQDSLYSSQIASQGTLSGEMEQGE